MFDKNNENLKVFLENGKRNEVQFAFVCDFPFFFTNFTRAKI